MRRRDPGYAPLRRDVGSLHGRSGQRLLDDAYASACAAHHGSLRASGDPYVTHCVAVAQIVTGWGLPLTSICAALLHDVPQESVDMHALRPRHGDEVMDLAEASFVMNVAPPTEGLSPQHPLYPAAMLKLADRLHNARTWQHIPRDRARNKAAQTLSIHAPIAKELGMGRVAEELTMLSSAALTLSPHQELPACGDSEPAFRGATPTTGGGLAYRLLDRAVLLLPAHRRHRYLQEWSGELAALDTARERRAFAAGLVYSAVRMRHGHRSPRTGVTSAVRAANLRQAGRP